MSLEFILSYILGFFLYEYLLKRYFSLLEKKYFIRAIIAFVSISIFTLKYYSWIVFFSILIILIVLYILERVLAKILSGEKFLLEKFIVRTTILIVIFIMLGSIITDIEQNRWFDIIWNKVIDKHIKDSPKILLYAICYIFVIDGGTVIVKGMLKKFPMLTQKAMDAISRSANGKRRREKPVTVRSEQENSGEIIGIIERILILTFVLVGSYEAVAFSVAAKSIARFNELDDKYFAEYYLLGTSMSVGIAVSVGVLVKQLI